MVDPVGVASVVDALEEVGIQGILEVDWRRTCSGRFLGPAATIDVRFVSDGSAERTRAHWHYVDQALAGAVLVVATGAAPVTTFGGVIAAVAAARGLAGAVTDGAIRDVDDIRQTGFPVAFSTINPRNSFGFYEIVGCGGQVNMGGVAVAAGDVIVADGDGVVAVPSRVAGDVLARAREIERLEGIWTDHARAYRSVARAHEETSRTYGSAH